MPICGKKGTTLRLEKRTEKKTGLCTRRGRGKVFKKKIKKRRKTSDRFKKRGKKRKD